MAFSNTPSFGFLPIGGGGLPTTPVPGQPGGPTPGGGGILGDVRDILGDASDIIGTIDSIADVLQGSGGSGNSVSLIQAIERYEKVSSAQARQIATQVTSQIRDGASAQNAKTFVGQQMAQIYSDPSPQRVMQSWKWADIASGIDELHRLIQSGGGSPGGGSPEGGMPEGGTMQGGMPWWVILLILFGGGYFITQQT